MIGSQRSVRQVEKGFPDNLLSGYEVGWLTVSQGQKSLSDGKIVINQMHASNWV